MRTTTGRHGGRPEGSARGRQRGPGAAEAAAAALAAALLLGVAGPAAAQSEHVNLRHPPSEIEERFATGSFEVEALRGARFPDDPTKQATLSFEDGTRLLAKWAPAPRGGERFNAVPRYEEAIYRLQKLFLDEDEYVVPPTVCRCVPVWRLGDVGAESRPTFEDTSCVLVTLQSWLWSITEENVFDRERFGRDTTYARHLANLNVVTYLAEHKDANVGNFLISTVETVPRVFAVDNGVAFASRESNRGTDWRRMRVDRIPAETADRLRRLEREDLERALATVAQFERTGSEGMVRVEPGPPLDPGEGIRRADGVLQLGLTRGEIDGVHDRLRRLVRRLERGDLGTF